MRRDLIFTRHAVTTVTALQTFTHVSLKARKAVLLSFLPANSRGKAWPATGLPLMAALQTRESTNSEIISCLPVAERSLSNSTRKGAPSLFQESWTCPMTERNHSVCTLLPSPPAMKSHAGFTCRLASPVAPLKAPKYVTKPFFT